MKYYLSVQEEGFNFRRQDLTAYPDSDMLLLIQPQHSLGKLYIMALADSQAFPMQAAIFPLAYQKQPCIDLVYLVCWCLQACECCRDCSGQAETIAGQQRMRETQVLLAVRTTHPADQETSKSLTCTFVSLMTLTSSSSFVFTAWGQPFCPICIVATGFIPHDHHCTMMTRAKKRAVTSLEALLQSEVCPSSAFKILTKIKLSCCERE